MEQQLAKYLPLTCTGHSRPVTHLSFSNIFQNGSYLLISACKDGAPMLRDGITGDWIGTFAGHKGAVWSAEFSNNAQLAVTGSADFTAKVWDTNTGSEIASYTHSHIVRAAAFIPAYNQPQFCVTAGNEKKIRVWDLNRGDSEASLNEWVGSDATIKSALWVEKNIIVTAGDDCTLNWWDLRLPKKTIGSAVLDGPINQMEERDEMICVAAGPSVYVFDTFQRIGLKKQTLNYKVSSATIHPSKLKFAAGSVTDTWVRFHDFERGDVLDVVKGHHGPVHSISYAPDGQLCASGGEDGTIRLWKTEPGPFGLWR
ncbi:WD40-repeat-containing domain protein [Lipomyces arxii]|uniref:WD40-repeat-containing domain protein n=1 Tax=Lipomyces arxii TaxID=56418 RepID=UPI0034CD60A5